MNANATARPPRLNRRGKRVRRSRGYTLIELTLAIGLALGVSSVIISVLAQHSSFMTILSQFEFLRDDAPHINSLMSRLTGQAVSYRLYETKQDAFDSTNAVNSGATAVRLIFRNPNGLIDQAVVVFETAGSVDRLNYYQLDGGWGTVANWTISSKATNVVFADNTGILEMTLTGPNGSQITYTATME